MSSVADKKPYGVRTVDFASALTRVVVAVLIDRVADACAQICMSRNKQRAHAKTRTVDFCLTTTTELSSTRRATTSNRRRSDGIGNV
jgi:penicillin V acylase-like amidase (Ntn superfamily)